MSKIEDFVNSMRGCAIILYMLELISLPFFYAYKKGLLFIWVIPILFAISIVWIIFIGYKNNKYRKEIDIVKKTYKNKEWKLEAAYNKKHKDLEQEYITNKRILENREDAVKRILSSNTPFKESAQLFADMHVCLYEASEYYLRHKSPPASKSADEIRKMKKMMNKELALCKEMYYKYEFLLYAFPELRKYVDDDNALVTLGENATYEDFKKTRDRTMDYLSSEEYKKLSVDERNQLALDRYKKKIKSNWELGIEYELYIGYLLREGKKPFNRKFHVIQFGELHELSDMGRDIIAEVAELNGNRTIYVIQCKRWSEKKYIHENTICQLYGTTIEYKIRHRHFRNCKFIPMLITTTELSDMAKEFAKYLEVVVCIIPMGEFPMIKCNINNGEKIYHLPFDQQYHRTEIKNAGEFYAMTVKDATCKGFRRAMKHFLN